MAAMLHSTRRPGREILRVLKPGGHLVAFSGTRTYHRMTAAIEDAGFEVRDSILEVIASDTPIAAFLDNLSEAQGEAFLRCIEESQFGGLLAWVYGSGFPKSLNLGKAIDACARCRAADSPGEETLSNDIRSVGLLDAQHGARPGFTRPVAAAGSEQARQWEGWGTALKPSFEPICLARKPLKRKIDRRQCPAPRNRARSTSTGAGLRRPTKRPRQSESSPAQASGQSATKGCETEAPTI
jgi:hypothetical protein